MTDMSASYLQCILALFLFNLGLPVLVFQLAVDEEVRQFLFRNSRRMWVVAGLGALVHLALAVGVLLFGAEGFGDWGADSVLKWAKGLFAVLMISTVFFWGAVLRQPVRRRIVMWLRRRSIRSLERGALGREEFHEDLRLLGVGAKSKVDRREVLQALVEIGDRIIVRDGYSGRDLEGWLGCIEDVVLAGEDEWNMIFAGEFLSRVRVAAGSSPDAAQAIRVTGRLGQRAIRLGSKLAGIRILDLVGKDASVLYRLGKEAVLAGEFLLLSAILNRLETVAEQVAETRGDRAPVRAYLLGLVAILGVSVPGSRARIEVLLERLGGWKVALEEERQRSLAFFRRKAEYETAAALMDLRL